MGQHVCLDVYIDGFVINHGGVWALHSLGEDNIQVGLVMRGKGIRPLSTL